MPNKPLADRGAEGLADWHIKNMDKATRRRVVVFAAQYDMTVGQAIKELIDVALGFYEAIDSLDVDPEARRRTLESFMGQPKDVITKGEHGKRQK